MRVLLALSFDQIGHIWKTYQWLKITQKSNTQHKILVPKILRRVFSEVAEAPQAHAVEREEISTCWTGGGVLLLKKNTCFLSTKKACLKTWLLVQQEDVSSPSTKRHPPRMLFVSTTASAGVCVCDPPPAATSGLSRLGG